MPAFVPQLPAVNAAKIDPPIRYEPDDPCPPLVTLSVGFQGVLLVISSMVLVVTVTARAGAQSDSYLSWAIFATLAIAGVFTAVQAGRFPRLGASHLLIMGPTLSYVAVSALALSLGGPSLLAGLTVASGLAYLSVSLWLPLLRRIFTPVVSGTVLMLIATMIIPVALNRVTELPAAAPKASGPVIAVVTLAVLVAMSLGASGPLKIWSPVIAIAAGCLIAAPFGAFDFTPISEAPWVGLPSAAFPGIDLTPGVEFWALLPAFLVVALVGCVRNIGDFIAVKQVSWNRSRATDFRLVQGCLNTNALGILLSGLAGTPPTAGYSTSSPLLISQTGVASRSVGYVIGLIMAVLALLPKLTAALLVIPGPVMAGYLLTGIAVLFVHGITTSVSDGLDRGAVLTIGVSFAVGVGLSNQTIGADLLGATWGPLIDSGMPAGALTAVLVSRFAQRVERGHRARMRVTPDGSTLNAVDVFLRDFAAEIGWDGGDAGRLRSAGEETLLSLLPSRTSAEPLKQLILTTSQIGMRVELEFLAVFDDQNLEDRLSYLDEESRSSGRAREDEISLRLLRHYASSVHHQKFHGIDVVTVRVEAQGQQSRPSSPP